MKLTSLFPPAAAVAMMAAAVLATIPGAQAKQDPPQAAATTSQTGAQAPNPPADGTPQPDMAPGGMRMHNYPAPTNLQVLPKDLTGRQVREIMRTWAGSLGVHCDFCHVIPNKPGPNGRPELDFPNDAKPDKQIARIMYTMTQQINAGYISKAEALDTDAMGMKVTCGTCHRGHEMPENFVVPHEGPHGGAPPAGAAPPASN